MEPVYYVIAILGCADGSTQCTPVATQQALVANSDFDFPTLMAQCRATLPRATAAQDKPEQVPATSLRG